jgi:hypothetical protein
MTIPRHPRRPAAALAAAAVLAAGLQLAMAGAASATQASTNTVTDTTVSYQGLSLRVPAGWDAVDLAAHPETCVRMDQHVVYLGHPGADQSCPPHGAAAKTEAIILEPFAGAGPRTDIPTVTVPAGAPAPGVLPADESRELRVAFEGAGVYATVSYGDSETAAEQIIGSATVTGGATPKAVPPAPITPLASSTPTTGYKGKAFDACTAPSATAMTNWAASPYRGVGVYIGGPSRYCEQPNLNASWVAARSSAGWHIVPIYNGRQASEISASTAATQGRASADDAVADAKALGLPAGAVLYIDMEQYSSGYRTNVLNYLSGWADRLHDLHYRAGVYGSSSSAMADLASVYTSKTLVRPDAVWAANWNGKADTSDPNLPAGDWANHQRVHQYSGNVTESYGGTSITIDRDYVDIASAVSTGDPGMTDLTAGDFNGNGKKDLVAVEVSTGKLWLYPGTGSGTLTSRVLIGSGGWNGMSNLTVGDYNGDGKEDVVAVEVSTGKLWLYPGTGSGLDSRTEIGTGGWNGMTNLFGGDFTGDGKDDVGGVEVSTGKLWLYPGTGSGLGSRKEIGSGGWNGMSKIVSPGDMNQDSNDDVVATEKSTGMLWLYRGYNNGTLDGGSTRILIGSGGWNGISDYAGGDFTGEGIGDLAAVESQPGATGKLYLYKGTGDNGLSPRIEIGNGGW